MILLIHGIDQQEFIDKQDQLAKKWNKLLRDGLMGVGAHRRKWKKSLAVRGCSSTPTLLIRSESGRRKTRKRSALIW